MYASVYCMRAETPCSVLTCQLMCISHKVASCAFRLMYTQQKCPVYCTAVESIVLFDENNPVAHDTINIVRSR